MHRGALIGLVGFGLCFNLVACGGPSADDVRQRTSTIVTRVIHESGQSLRGASDLKEIKELIESLEAMIPGLTGLTDDAPMPDGLPKGDSLDFGDIDEQRIAAEVNKFLAEHVFNDNNVVSSGGDTISFQLRGSDLCKEISPQTCMATPGTPPVCNTDPSDMSQCIEMVDKLQVRIAATLIDGDGVDLALRVGNGTVVTLRLRSDRVTVELDLAGVSDAANHVASVTGEQIYLPKTMKGALAMSLVINGPGDLSLQSAITKALHVEAGDAKDPIVVKAEARDPLSEVRFQSSGPSLSVNVDWGAVELVIPAGQIWDMASGSTSAMLKGFTAKLFADNSGLQITGVGLGQGPSSFKLNGKTVVQVEMQGFDMELLPWQSLPKCVFKPGVDLAVKLNLAHLQPYVTEPIEPWALNESYRLQLSGQSPEVAPVSSSSTFPDGGLRVLKGSLTLRSELQPASVTVPTGSCLRWSDQVAQGGHPLLGHFQSVTCP